MIKSTSSVLSSLLILFILAQTINSQSTPNPQYLGSLDPGVSHFPEFEGLKMHIRCYSSSVVNGKTVIFDSGLPWFGSAYASVIELLIPKMNLYGISKACLFDRYGMGFSDASTIPVQGLEFARKLKGSMDILGLCAPYIYVGWSWGGLGAQFFSILYPNQVQGVYLIESSDRYLYEDTSFTSQLPGFVSAITEMIDMNNEDLRDLGNNGSIVEVFGYPPSNTNIPAAAINITQEVFLDPSKRFLIAARQEVQCMMPYTNLLDAAYNSSTTNTPLNNIPLLVLYSSNNEPSWITRQTNLQFLSSNSEVHADDYSTHMVPFDNPSKIVDLMQNLINRINNTPQTATYSCGSSSSTSTSATPSITITTTTGGNSITTGTTTTTGGSTITTTTTTTTTTTA